MAAELISPDLAHFPMGANCGGYEAAGAPYPDGLTPQPRECALRPSRSSKGTASEGAASGRRGGGGGGGIPIAHSDRGWGARDRGRGTVPGGTSGCAYVAGAA